MVDAGCRPTFAELGDEFTKMARDPGRYLHIEVGFDGLSHFNSIDKNFVFV